MLCIVYTCKIGSLSAWHITIDWLGRFYYVKMVYRDRLNPFDRYDDWDGDSGLV